MPKFSVVVTDTLVQVYRPVVIEARTAEIAEAIACERARWNNLEEVHQHSTYVGVAKPAPSRKKP